MKKKDYQTPTMQVVKLQHQAHLLQASAQENLKDYNWHDYEEE